MQETQEDPLEKEMATHSGILPWRIPWTQEPGGLQSMGSQELGMTERPSAHTRSHARAHTHTHTRWLRLQCCCLILSPIYLCFPSLLPLNIIS